MELRFNLGDIVECVYSLDNSLIIGQIGRIIGECIFREECYFVEFERFVDGHDANGRGRKGHCWSCLASHLRMVEALNESAFNVGDRVICVAPHASIIDYSIKGKVGTIIGHSIYRKVPLVEFDENVGGHNGRCRAERNGKDGHCWYCRDKELEIFSQEPAAPASTRSNTVASLIEDDAIVKVAEAAMPDGVDFDFIGCAKRAPKNLAKACSEPKSPEATPPLFNGALACVENKLDPRAFTIGKVYYAIDGVVLDNVGFRYEPIDWLDDNPASGFCVYNTVDGPLVKFVVLTDADKVE